MKRFAFVLLAAAAASSACIESPPSPDDRREGRPVAVDDTIVVDADGLARAELWLGALAEVRTLGVAVRIEGADVVEWERDDSLFTQNGGRVIPLESKVDGDTFRMIAGTSAPGTAGDAGVRLASFVLRPRAGETIRLVPLDDPSLGAVNAGGTRIDLVRDGALSVRSGGAQ